ncbi:AAA family ATPase [Streptomyces sp. NBC_00287]|uniref:helix-turn-helix transcriptional regulator n=1 Tax=Streptomyces sp. NBC_00287 TaxID=2975702 RepID=UPI002E298E1F|nr:AAA family ATPase [Streptomyces sp. NBC_00287]
MALIQREAQLDRLRTAFHNCGDQHGGQVCLITGGVGSGKTALLEAFADYVTQRSAHLLRAVGSRAERNLQFAVMDQLIDSSGLGRASIRQVASAVRHLARTAPPTPPGDDLAGLTTPEPEGPPYPGPATAEQPLPSTVHGRLAALLDLARPAPLVIAIDDVHHADQASLQCLLYAVRRLRHKRMMVVLTESPALRAPHPHFRAELMSQPCFSRIDLAPLTDEALGMLAETHPVPSARARIARRAPALTGGSPLLMRALLEDPTATGTAPGGGSDAPLAQAVLCSLYRHEPEVRATAQTLAVLGRPTPMPVLARLLALTPDLTAQALQLLGQSGLVDGDRIRRPLVAAVLADLPAEERRRLHRRVAAVLHEFGAEPEVIARHLIGADWAEPDWAQPALHRAAAQALDSGRPDLACACLRLTQRQAPGGQGWTSSDSMLLRSRWQLNPLSATTDLGALAAAEGPDGYPPAALTGVPALLWQERSDTACAIVTAVARRPDLDPKTRARLAAARLLISLCRPDHYPQARTEARSSTDSGTATSVTGRHLDALALLADTLAPERGGRDAAADAESMIQRYLADDGALGLLAALLLVMVYAGRPGPVREWTRLLLARPSVGYAPSWKAVLHAIRAEAALRLGCPQEAEEQGRAALTVITPQAWGVAVAAPLGTLVAAATEAGRFEDADRWLARPVPAESFRTPLGLHYLAARARYQLAIGCRRAAADDLRWVRREMAAWRMDSAALVPWRLDLARVHIALGQQREAVRLLEEQLDPARPVDERTRGSALRLLAGLVPPEQGRQLLVRAVKLLENSGDRRELARALSDRARSLRQPTGPAPVVARRAHSRAPAEESLCPERPRRQRPERAEQLGALSEAESRVAALAAQGHTNRQISSKLFITVSTVEQHLTRIYRKLDVKQRTDLATRLAAVGALGK